MLRTSPVRFLVKFKYLRVSHYYSFNQKTNLWKNLIVSENCY